MADIRLTRRRIANHFRYTRWWYLVVALLCAFGLSALFSMTRYRPPREHLLSFYVTSGPVFAEQLQGALWPELQARRPEQEELTVVGINLRDEQMYARMQYATYLSAGEGDVLLLDRVEYDRLKMDATEGETFVDLGPAVHSGMIPRAKLSEMDAQMLEQTGALYAVSADVLTGLMAFGCDTRGAVLTAPLNRPNTEAAEALIGILLDRYGEGGT